MQVHASARGPNWAAEAPADHRAGPAGVPHVWHDSEALQKDAHNYHVIGELMRLIHLFLSWPEQG